MEEIPKQLEIVGRKEKHVARLMNNSTGTMADSYSSMVTTHTCRNLPLLILFHLQEDGDPLPSHGHLCCLFF